MRLRRTRKISINIVLRHLVLLLLDCSHVSWQTYHCDPTSGDLRLTPPEETELHKQDKLRKGSLTCSQSLRGSFISSCHLTYRLITVLKAGSKIVQVASRSRQCIVSCKAKGRSEQLLKALEFQLISLPNKTSRHFAIRPSQTFSHLRTLEHHSPTPTRHRCGNRGA